METLKRYNVYTMGADPDVDDISESPTGRWMEAADVLRVLCERDAEEQDHSEAYERVCEERRILEEKLDESILAESLQRNLAEALVTQNAELLAARNRATLSCRYANKLRDVDIAELAAARKRIGHLTGRTMDAAVLLNRLVNGGSKNPFEVVQQAREFVALLRADTEGYTLTGPCDIPLLYAKIDLLKEDGTPMQTNEQQTPMPAPESGVGYPPTTLEGWMPIPPPVVPLKPNGMTLRPATDGTPVECHPEFARVYDQAPGLWQGTLDSAAADAKRLGIDPASPSEEDQRALMQAVIDAPPAPLRPLNLVEDRTDEQLRADGDHDEQQDIQF